METTDAVASPGGELSARAMTALGLVGAIAGFGLAGWVGALVGVAVVIAGRAGSAVLIRRAGMMAIVLLIIAAWDTVRAGDTINRGFADRRELAHSAGSLAAVLVVVLVATALVADRRSSDDAGAGEVAGDTGVDG